MKKLLLIGLIASQTACAGLFGESLFVGEDEGRFLLSADRAGMQEFGRAVAGVAQVAKDSPDVQGAYWTQQRDETEVKKLRISVGKKGVK